MGKLLIVDDADPTQSFTYRGNWQQQTTVVDANTNTNEYNSTVHKSGSGGDTMEFRFQGIGISVYGTLDHPGTNGVPDATFAVDTDTPVRFNSSSGTTVTVSDPNKVTSHVLLYKSAVLGQAEHVLRIVSNGGASFYFDYLTVDIGTGVPAGGNTTSSTSDLMRNGKVIVDDRDASVSYTGTWTDTTSLQEYLGTTRLSPSKANGGNATFQFSGQSISVYGSTDVSAQSGGNPTKIQFTLDDGENGAVNQYSYESAASTNGIYHIPFFTKSGLATDRMHTLVVTPANDSPFFLDYFVYTPVETSGGGTTSGPNIGIIVGAAVGGVVVLFLLFCAVFLWRRKRRQGAVDGERRRRGRFSSEKPKQDHSSMVLPRPFYSNTEYAGSQPQMVPPNGFSGGPVPSNRSAQHQQQHQQHHQYHQQHAQHMKPALAVPTNPSSNTGSTPPPASSSGGGIGRGWSPSGSPSIVQGSVRSGLSGRGSSEGRGSPGVSRSGNDGGGGDFSNPTSFYPQFIGTLPNTSAPVPTGQPGTRVRPQPPPLTSLTRSTNTSSSNENDTEEDAQRARRSRPPTSEKSRFGYTPTFTHHRHQQSHPAPPMSATTASSITPSSPSMTPYPEMEEDSGLRIPPTLPPRYTED
ncbi:hypothetical protein FRC15_009497 [Serendipita sp. 397]|nr:hypothetical protein FRC15_009497 [Serendipita sp. 397]